MPVFEFKSPDGKTYEVNGPDGSTKEEAFAHLQSQLGSGAAAPNQENSIIDSIRSIPGGIAKGVAGIVGLPGDISHLANVGLDKLTGANVADKLAPLQPINSANINDAISKPFGGYYEPKTPAGRFTETASSFAPAIFGGEASLGSRLLGRALAPAAGSQVLGSAVDESKSPVLHGAAEIGGALLGGGLAGGTRAAIQSLKSSGETAEQSAASKIGDILSGSGKTVQDIASVPGDKGITAAEAMGPAGVSYLATLGRRSGETGEALGNLLTTRAVSAPSRMMSDFTKASGIDPGAAAGNFDNILEAGKKRAAPLYEEAYAANQNIASPHIDRILDTPAGKKALADARVNMQNDMSLMGTPDADLIAQAREGGTTIPKRGVASGMKLRVYDYVKKSLDDQVDAAYRAGNKHEAGIISGLKQSLVKGLDDADVTASAGPNSLKPEGGKYAQARRAAGEYLSAKEAFSDGQDHILNSSVSARDVQKYVADLSDAQREAYKGGIANKILLQAQNGRLTPKLLGVPAVQEKLKAALGPDKAQIFIDGITQEASLAKTGSRMMPGTGSITSDVMLNAGEQDRAADLAAALQGAKALGHASSGNLGSAALSGIAAMRHVAPDFLKTGGMSVDTRNELGKLLMLSPQDYAQKFSSLPQAPLNPTMLSRILMVK
jgi:hypothetical protein